jgi:hypothetical protein
MAECAINSGAGRGTERRTGDRIFLFFRPRINSIVFRLLGQFEFVDRRRNSIDPPSNEFAA